MPVDYTAIGEHIDPAGRRLCCLLSCRRGRHRQERQQKTSDKAAPRPRLYLPGLSPSPDSEPETHHSAASKSPARSECLPYSAGFMPAFERAQPICSNKSAHHSRQKAALPDTPRYIALSPGCKPNKAQIKQRAKQNGRTAEALKPGNTAIILTGQNKPSGR